MEKVKRLALGDVAKAYGGLSGIFRLESNK